MNIIIVGAGNVGFNLAEYFSAIGHQITVVDQDRDLCDQVNSKLDVFVVPGLGSDPSVLAEAKIENAHMLIAVTSNDETNLLACNFAMQNGVAKRIARIKASIYTANVPNISLERVGVTSVIEPERGVVDRILQYVELPNVLETANFQSNKIYLRGYMVKEDMPIANKTLKEIKVMAGDSPMLVVAIARGDKDIPPTGDKILQPGDKIAAIMPRESFPVFREMINSKSSMMNKIVVSGNSITAIHLAEALRPFAKQVFLVDPDAEHGQYAASVLQGIDVFHGDSTNATILDEINVRGADCFIAAGKDAEDNIMSCLLAKAEGAQMVIAIRDDDRYSGLFDSIGLDHVINTREITLNSIIERIQTVSIGTYLKLRSTDTEVIRLEVRKKSSLIGKPLKQLDRDFKKSVIIGCIIRDEEVIIPWGETTIQEKDEALVFCQKEHLKRVHKLFNPSSKE
ncbi:MAG: Trk system potassium transporter TrkA [Candidatus Omnitrophica bacterium]|nr:Trk system potassium transporter TrkA [Candidatus Omnitrophota bacterium]